MRAKTTQDMEKTKSTGSQGAVKARMLCIACLVLTLLTVGPGCSRKVKPPPAPEPETTQTQLPPPTPTPPREPQPVEMGVVTPQSPLSQEVRTKREPMLREEFKKASLRLGAPIFVRIFKDEKELELWVKKGETFQRFKTYRVANFSGKLGPKMREGDLQAPEGFYEVTPTRLNPRSNYHLAFNIGYPNEYDQVHKASGGLIMVHGKRDSVGCFAMTDPAIEEIYTIADFALNSGQPSFAVHIFPFRMTAGNLMRHSGSPHMAFWRGLLRGYLLFELTRYPPAVEVTEARYAFANGLQQRKTNVASVQTTRPATP